MKRAARMKRDAFEHLSAVDCAIAEMGRAARELMAKEVAQRADKYDRARDLPRLLRRIDPEIPTAPPAAVIFVLTQALKAEQAKVRTDTHWSGGTPSYGRMIRLRAAIIAERRAQDALDEASGMYAEVDAQIEIAEAAE